MLSRPRGELTIYLRLREAQRRREFRPLGDAQVLTLPELLLKRQQLIGREGRPGLSVRLVLPQVALDLGRLAVLWKQEKKCGTRFQWERRRVGKAAGTAWAPGITLVCTN